MGRRRTQRLQLQPDCLFGRIISFTSKFIFQYWIKFEHYQIWSSKTIAAETRKIRASWTPELAQDIQSYQGFNAEAELTELLSSHINAAINNEIIGQFRGIQKHIKSIAKKRRYKDRKLYIREIEEWSEIKINSEKIDALI